MAYFLVLTACGHDNKATHQALLWAELPQAFYLILAFSPNTLQRISMATEGPSCDHRQLVSSFTLVHKAPGLCLYFKS